MKLALITPSYAGDLDLCRLLVETAKRCLRGDVTHYLLIDRRDVHLFGDLASARTRILVAEDLLPDWIARDPTQRHVWTSKRTPPIYNWVLQQLLKLAVFDAIREDLVVFCDSDVAFVRPFDLPARVVLEDTVAFLRVEETPGPQWRAWQDVAHHLLGLQNTDRPIINYIGNLIAWRRENVMALRRHIEALHRRPWLEVVAGQTTLSEYQLYGIFIEQVLGLDAAGHRIENTAIIKPSWGVTLDDPRALDRFFAEFEPGHVGVMIHSRDQFPVARYRDRILALIQQAQTAGGGR